MGFLWHYYANAINKIAVKVTYVGLCLFAFFFLYITNLNAKN